MVPGVWVPEPQSKLTAAKQKAESRRVLSSMRCDEDRRWKNNVAMGMTLAEEGVPSILVSAAQRRNLAVGGSRNSFCAALLSVQS